MYPQQKKNRRVLNEFNVKNSAKLSGTEFAMAFEQAKAIIKSIEEQKNIGKEKLGAKNID